MGRTVDNTNLTRLKNRGRGYFQGGVESLVWPPGTVKALISVAYGAPASNDWLQARVV